MHKKEYIQVRVTKNVKEALKQRMKEAGFDEMTAGVGMATQHLFGINICTNYIDENWKK